MRTDRTIRNNKPDITARDNGKGSNVLIDAAIPGDRIVIKREAEKVLKYKDLIREIQCMWIVEAKVIPDNNSRGNWNYLKVTQTVPEQHTGRARN